MAFASDVAGAPMSVAAILLLGTGSALEPAVVRAAIGDRIRMVPRLRQRLVEAPFGCGRPYWLDDPGFDICNHFRHVSCPAPGDETALLDIAADTVTRPLASSRPLWSATLVTGLADDGAALIVALHHVIADGVGGLAVLAQLVDGAVGRPSCDFPVDRRGDWTCSSTHFAGECERQPAFPPAQDDCAQASASWPSAALAERRGPH